MNSKILSLILVSTIFILLFLSIFGFLAYPRVYVYDPYRDKFQRINYGTYYPKYMHTSDKEFFQQSSASDWKYKPSYSYFEYGRGNRYGHDYYYAPRIDSYTGAANWNY